MIGKKRDTPIFRFNPAVLQEGVDYSYTHNPPNWSDPLEMISARGTTAILLKDMSVTFIPSEKNLGVFKKGYMFDIYQYDSKYKLIDVKNKALFRVHDIEK